MTRRSFLGNVAVAAMFRNDALKTLERIAGMPVSEAGDDDEYWLRVREAFDVEKDFLFLNHGGICPSPRVVADAEVRRIRDANRAPAYEVFRRQEHEIEGIRARLAKLFECDPEELAVMPNASQGLFAVIMGIRASRGDTIATTEHDYPRVITAFLQRERRDGANASFIPIPSVPASPDELQSSITEALSLRPRLLAIPRVGYLNGTLFPAAELCARAKDTDVLTLVDGAHAIGHLPDTAKSLGCDTYACCLHKWILGPLGSGFLFVRKERIGEIWSLGPSDQSLETNIRKFEQFGTRPTGILLSINEALDAHEAIGRNRKSQRLEHLRTYWTSKLADHPKIRFNTNLDPAVSRVLTNVAIEGLDSPKLAGWLFDKKRIFVTTGIKGHLKGIRISAQIYTTKRELDRLVAALLDAAEHGIG